MNTESVSVYARAADRVRPIFQLLTEHPLATAIALAVLFRVVVFFATMIMPIPNEDLFLVSPLHGQKYLDFSFYVESLHQYRSETIWSIFQKFVHFYQRPLEEHFGHIIAGPIFPLIIGIFDYTDGNTLPLATCFLFFNCLWWVIWLRWFAEKGLGLAWLCIMALMPNPVWFMLVVSPDFVLAALVGFFYVLYMREQQTAQTMLLCAFFVVCIVLTRPNGYSVLIFVLLDNLWRHYRSGDGNLWLIALVGVSTFLVGLYLYPYVVIEARKMVINHVFFGMSTSTFWAGLFPKLPDWLDIPLSLLALGGAKILYFVGLRPSYGMANDGLVLLRALPGLVLLPGLVWGLFFAGMRTRLFLITFLLPVLMGPSQDRYNLPLFPLLFGFGAHAMSVLWQRLRRSDQD